MEEALHHKSKVKYNQQGEEIKQLKKDFHLSIKNSESWLSIPRVFTRRCARFELPMDSRLLNGKLSSDIDKIIIPFLIIKVLNVNLHSFQT